MLAIALMEKYPFGWWWLLTAALIGLGFYAVKEDDMSTSHLELLLAEHIKDRDLPTPIREYLFAHELGRKWRADFAWPDLMLLVEVEGGTKGKSRHTQADGFQVDCRKYNDAAILGYAVLRFTAEMINTHEAVNTIQEFIEDKENGNNR